MNRQILAAALIITGVCAALAGFLKWNSTKPDLGGSAGNAANALNSLTTGATVHYNHAQPAWLWIGLAVGAVLVTIGLALLATGRHHPQVARTYTPAITGPAQD